MTALLWAVVGAALLLALAVLVRRGRREPALQLADAGSLGARAPPHPARVGLPPRRNPRRARRLRGPGARTAGGGADPQPGARTRSSSSTSPAARFRPPRASRACCSPSPETRAGTSGSSSSPTPPTRRCRPRRPWRGSRGGSSLFRTGKAWEYPWAPSFASGTIISSGLVLARKLLRRDHIAHPHVVLVSDLSDAESDLQKLETVIAQYQRERIDLRVIRVSPDATPSTGSLANAAFVASAADQTIDPTRTGGGDALPILLAALVGLLGLLAAVNELALHPRPGGRRREAITAADGSGRSRARRRDRVRSSRPCRAGGARPRRSRARGRHPGGAIAVRPGGGLAPRRGDPDPFFKLVRTYRRAVADTSLTIDSSTPVRLGTLARRVGPRTEQAQAHVMVGTVFALPAGNGSMSFTRLRQIGADACSTRRPRSSGPASLLDDRNEAAKYDLELALAAQNPAFSALSGRRQTPTQRPPGRNRHQGQDARAPADEEEAQAGRRVRKRERLRCRSSRRRPSPRSPDWPGSFRWRSGSSRAAGRRPSPRPRAARARGARPHRAAPRPGVRLRAARPRRGAALAGAPARTARAHGRPDAPRPRQLAVDARVLRPTHPVRASGAPPSSRASCAPTCRSSQPAWPRSTTASSRTSSRRSTNRRFPRSSPAPTASRSRRRRSIPIPSRRPSTS